MLGAKRSQSSKRRGIDQELLLSDEFAFAFDCEGSPIVYHLTSPDRHIRLSMATRVLLASFSPRVPLAVSEAQVRVCRYCGIRASHAVLAKLQTAVEGFLRCGVLVPATARAGAYTAEMIRCYPAAREVPPEVCRVIAREGAIRRNTTVLDIGTGPGSIAIQLASRSDRVTAMDISQGFLTVAQQIARSLQRRVRFVRGDANRLIFERARYDVITAGQVLHWLDPDLSARGISRSLADQGRLFVLESKSLLSPQHPFRKHFAYGQTSHGAVMRECARHTQQHAQMFLQNPTRDCRLILTGKWIFRQQRSFDLEFARAYFFEQVSGPPWSSMSSLDRLPPNIQQGYMYWLLLRFEKDAENGDIKRACDRIFRITNLAPQQENVLTRSVISHKSLRESRVASGKEIE